MIPAQRVLAAAACTVMAVSSLIGCSTDTTSGANGTSSSSTAPEKPATKPDRLVIRIWSGDEQKAYADTAGKAFTDATGIPIVWDTTDEAVSYAKLNQEIGAGQPPSDDASFNAQQRAYTNAARGWTIPISPELAPNIAKVTAETAAPADVNGSSWAYLNPYTLSVPFIVRTDKLDPNQVTTWDDLLKPNLKQAIAIDSIYSSTAFGFAQSLGVNPATNPPDGMAPVWDRISGIKPNLAQLGSNADVVTALSNGSVSLAISNTGSGISAIAAGAPIKMVAPKNGLYVVGDSYYIHKGIPAPNAYYAQVFANYLLDPAVQSAVADKLGFVPVNPAATVPQYMSADPAVFPRSAADLKAENAIVAPIPLMAHNDEAWQKAFDNAIGK